ncbi:hypothetical protein E2C01_039133 [Portunus trituberculatus]|uniref:Uncharacterized protein n=1 Tax=Portunus trituberculatus TaxID=210409 RepID=A0A5B7FLX3_PORTR|nr:hypothetical protein [Portunus trituberculatus]
MKDPRQNINRLTESRTFISTSAVLLLYTGSLLRPVGGPPCFLESPEAKSASKYILVMDFRIIDSRQQQVEISFQFSPYQ